MDDSSSGSSAASISQPNLNFQNLDIEFEQIFRRGIKQVKRILSFGQPGTTKTLMPQKIGKIQNTVERKVANGRGFLVNMRADRERTSAPC
jgi:Cdc6-like AAA superfamily ATPase